MTKLRVGIHWVVITWIPDDKNKQNTLTKVPSNNEHMDQTSQTTDHLYQRAQTAHSLPLRYPRLAGGVSLNRGYVGADSVMDQAGLNLLW